jgi:hypothetical protein
MADAMEGLSFEQMARVEAMVLPRLVRHIDPVTREGAPAGYSYAKDQLARALNRVAPERAKEKRAQAMAKRGVKIRILEEEGLAQICLWTTKVQGISFYERINEMAEASVAEERQAVQDTGHDLASVRTINQARADVLVEMVMNSKPTPATTSLDCANVPARVNVGVLIDLPTLLALRDNPSELPGYGPLDPELARALAADNEWRRFLHDPITGQILDLGHAKYEPSRKLRMFFKTTNLENQTQKDIVCEIFGLSFVFYKRKAFSIDFINVTVVKFLKIKISLGFDIQTDQLFIRGIF